MNASITASQPDLIFNISRITAGYDATEDRLVLSVANKQGELRQLWLTRRLADRLLATLIEDLSRSTADSAEKPPPATSPERDAAAQIYAQLAARLVKKPTPAVEPGGDLPTALVLNIKLSRRPRHWRLTWICQEAAPAFFRLNTVSLRQWLESMQAAYRLAGWSAPFWPQWLGRHH